MAEYENNEELEEWRDVVGYEDRYEVSSFGRVRRKAHMLKPHVNRQTGYASISLGRGKRKTVHRLICEAFHGQPPSEEHWQVAHGDRDRLNNRPENLRWATPRENTQDAIAHGSAMLIQYQPRPANSEDHPRAKLTEAQVIEIRRRGATDEPRQNIADEFGIDRTHLWAILTGKTWKKDGGPLGYIDGRRLGHGWIGRRGARGAY